jgi:hypothetical protein
MDPQEEREKPRSVGYIPRPFTSPSQPQSHSGESFQLGERSRTTVSTRGQPLYPYGKFKSYEEMLEHMDEEDPFRDLGQPGGSSDSPQTREFLRRGSGHDRLREKHERSMAIRKDFVPGNDTAEKIVKSGDYEKTVKHRRKTRDKRKIREKPGLPVEVKLSGTYTKDTYEYSNPAYEPNRSRDLERTGKENEKYKVKKRDGSKGRAKLTGESDNGSTGTYTLEEKDDQTKLIKDKPDFGALTEPMEKAFFMRKDYIRVDKNASNKRTGETLQKLRVDSRQTGFKSSKHHAHGTKRTQVGNPPQLSMSNIFTV